METKGQMKGYLLAAGAGLLSGISDTCGQYAFSVCTLSAVWLTVIRMLVGGTLLCGYNYMSNREVFLSLWRDKKDALQLLAFAVCGLMLSQFTTFQAIALTNAGTATVLQSLSPVLILLLTCLLGRKLPRGFEIAALALAFAGVFLLATHGHVNEMVLSPAGLVWGLLSAATAATYTLLSRRLVQKCGAVMVIGYGLAIGGVVLTLVSRVWTLPIALNLGGILGVSGTVVFGTLFAYSCYVAGCARIGAVKGSLLALLEPVGATVLAAVWLGSRFTGTDLLGFGCILATVVLLTVKK